MKIKKYVSIIVAMLCTIIVWNMSMNVVAADEQVVMSINKTSLPVGEAVTYGIWMNQNVSVELTVHYDTKFLEYVSCSNADAKVTSGEIVFTGTNDRTYVKFKAIGDGATRVTAEGTRLDGSATSTGAAVDIAGTGSEIADSSSNQADDSSLQSLTLEGVTLVPEFAYSITEYTGTVGSDVEQVAVNGFPSDKNATIESIEGNKSLVDGLNTIKVVVKSEDGNQTIYTIALTRGETSGSADDQPTPSVLPTYTYGATTYQVSNEYDSTQLPDGFAMVETEDSGQIIQVYRYLDTNIYMVYLVDTSNVTNGNLYIYDIENHIINFDIGYLQGGMSDQDNDDLDVLQQKYDKLYTSSKENEERSQMTFYIMIVIVVILFIILINVLIFTRRKHVMGDEDDEYLAQVASNGYSHDQVKEQHGKLMDRKDELNAVKQSNKVGMNSKKNQGDTVTTDESVGNKIVTKGKEKDSGRTEKSKDATENHPLSNVKPKKEKSKKVKPEKVKPEKVKPEKVKPEKEKPEKVDPNKEKTQPKDDFEFIDLDDL